ncbi:transcription factor grauzone [Anastrepha ludens]|uniref:transcription factor grauzone n=1 Tax=Anastrepha ludens TaxID=28586 RepID=UPI0023B02717|nr:transcription factor grauzone [Anastrepha ludens]
MTCRLCLRTLVPENAICLFESPEKETKLVKLIAKYLHLEITQDDPISTSLCEDCSDHLEEFHKFWTYVDLKQSSLGSEFLAVKCSEIKKDVSVLIDVSEENADSQEEILLDLKDIPAPETYDSSNIDIVPVPENISVTPDIKLDVDVDSYNNLEADSDWKNEDESFDDDIPLLSLKDKLQKNSSSRTKIIVKNHVRIKKIGQKCKKEQSSTEKQGLRTEAAKRNEEIIGNCMLLNCDLCNVCVENYNDLRLHFTQVHNRTAYVKCCGKTFHRPNILAEHVQWHTDPSKFKCDICGKQLRSSKCLASHMKMIHSKKEKVCCPICSKVFRGQKCLDNHIRRHKDDREYPCEICNKSFANPQRLRRHIEAIHENLQRHICDICGKAFKFKPSFERHVLEHQGIIEPPVQCDICGEWSKNKHVHRLHQFKHNNIDTDCKFCGRKCRSRTALRGHINYMHKKKYDLQCSFCDKTFKETRNLEEHMATHTGAQLYSCPHCSKECRSRSNMYVHIKRMHVNEWFQSKVARSNDPTLRVENVS